MNKIELIPEEKDTNLENLKDTISRAKEFIDEEFKETSNPWIRCFGSMIFPIEVYFNMCEKNGKLSAENLEKMRNKSKQLKVRLRKLIKEYPSHRSDVPEELKDELIKSLSTLIEEE